MDNVEDSENNAKVSDSGYSHSCSHSQSRSHSSKSTHSGSNSSGSSGYGGKPASSYGPKISISTSQTPDKRNKKKNTKTKKPALAADVNADKADTSVPENKQTFGNPHEEKDNVAPESSSTPSQAEDEVDGMNVTLLDNHDQVDAVNVGSCNNASVAFVSSRLHSSNTDGFSCVISLQAGVVMYATGSLTTALGFPKDMWIGRSLIDFVHPRDRDALAALITKGLAVPKTTNGMLKKATPATSTMVCRIRRYRGLSTGFGVKEASVTFMPFLIKFSFKNISEEEGQVTYLVLQTTPYFSAYKSPNEIVNRSTPFIIRHSASGNLEYIDPESVSYLGYLPQDVINKDALMLYHPEDLPYLKQIYEKIVREGSTPRCQSYRMLVQNGGFIKVETEWSSFINPWSKKLEFVTGKHYIIEGPLNPDVFLSPPIDKCVNLSEEEKKIAQIHRESILRILSEILTKPAELAKEKMTKRYQDLATFMEGLIEENPKEDEDLQIDIQDPDVSYYERDSLMFGGISPHHEYNDSKSSTETPLSYNQLNYNETLQRYFEGHHQFGEGLEASEVNAIAGFKNSKSIISNKIPSPRLDWGDTTELNERANSSNPNASAVVSCKEILPSTEYYTLRLTESLLNKHNSEMEKELFKKHREHCPSSKPDREKANNEIWHKNTEHLVRCSESFIQAAQTSLAPTVTQTHGVKRPFKSTETDVGHYKHHCSKFRQLWRRQVPFGPGVPSTSTFTCSTVVGEQKSTWSSNNVSSMNAFIFGVGLPQQTPMISPVPTVPVSEVYPMYNASAHLDTAAQNPPANSIGELNKNHPTFPAPMQCMMYGQAVYWSPHKYSPMTPPTPFNVPQNMPPTQMDPLNPLGLASSNYEEACKSSIYMSPHAYNSNVWQTRKRNEAQAATSKIDQDSGHSNASNAALNRPWEGAVTTTSSSGSLNKFKRHLNTSDDTLDRMDGESSYSSFYSSFFKSESGSADDSSDAKKSEYFKKDFKFRTFMPQPVKKVAKRKTDPPWLEQVCVTPNLMYKYQIINKNIDEVLLADQKKMSTLQQPSLVNEQLGQLYLDLHLEGVAARLTLEEGITSSSSSGEDAGPIIAKRTRRRRNCSKLVMIYEEDAPLPPATPETADQSTPSTSKF